MVALLFRFMNMEIVESATFRIQDSYCVDAIKDFQKEKLSENLHPSEVQRQCDGPR